jgi:hypothetical protein
MPNMLHAEARLLEKSWTLGAVMARLIERRWNPDNRSLEGGTIAIDLEGCFPIGHTYETGTVYDLTPVGFRQRLYTVEELREIYASVGMTLEGVFDAGGEPTEASPEEPEVLVVARKD